MRPSTGDRRWTPLLLVGIPLLLRLICLFQLRGTPFFTELFVDARTYHEMAVRILHGSFERATPFWQPPLYPYFLALLYRVFGPHPLAAQCVQALLGSLSCLLIFRMGRRVFGRTAAWIGWAAAAAYASLIFSDLQILGVGPALFLLLLGLDRLSLAAAGGSPSGAVRGNLLAGLALGLASVTVATMLLALPAAAVLAFRRRGLARGFLPLLAGVALPLGTVFASNLAVSGEPVVISYNGGVNFWIGNNPDYEETVAVRPGRAWVSLINEPARAGINSPSASSAYFFHKSWGWIRENPGAWLRLMAHKTRLFLRGDEIPRNQEIYPFRAASLLLRLLLWIHGIAFPFGLLLPLGGAGMVTALRRDRRQGQALWLFWTALPLALSVVFFFVTARYRLPVVPFLLLFAGAGISSWVTELRRREWPRLLPPALAAGILGLLANSGLPAMPGRFNSDAYSDLGTSYYMQGDLERARNEYQAALQRDPENMEATHNLGTIALRQGRWDDAARRFEKVLQRYPDDINALINLGNVAYQQNDPWKAGAYYWRAYRLQPDHLNALKDVRAAEAAAARLEEEGLRRDPEGFLESLAARAEREPENEFLFARCLKLLTDRGRNREALAVVRHRLAAAPGDARARGEESRLRRLVER